MTQRGAWMWAAGSVLIAVGIVVWVRERARVISHEPGDYMLNDLRMTIRRFAEDIRATNLADDAACRAALARIDAEREKWQGFSTESDVVAWRANIQAAVDARGRK